jgi:hypothetical protein
MYSPSDKVIFEIDRLMDIDIVSNASRLGSDGPVRQLECVAGKASDLGLLDCMRDLCM